MSVTNWITATSASEYTGVGFTSWTNPNNAAVADESFASLAKEKTSSTHGVVISASVSSIPSGATLDGIEAVVKGYGSVSGLPGNAIIVDDLGTIIASKAFSPAQLTNTEITIGGSTDKWSVSVLSDIIYATSFGVYFLSGYPTGDVFIDMMKIRFYYTSSSGSSIKTLNGLAKSSVKTLRSGLLIASGKTWDGLT